MTRHFILGTIASLVGISCVAKTPSSGPSLTIAVAPLNLPAVGRICYDVRVSDGPTLSDPAVWSRGTPGLNGGTMDAAALCSSSFGNGTGGDITFVGACVASPPDAGQNYRTNSVTLWIDGVYDASNTYISPTGSDGWQNPCPTPGGCTLTAACRENADTLVEFNLTILRQANQGFFDIGVNFEDIFCSAKVDCRDASGSPLKLLFKPGTSTRDTTVVSALACTAGPGSAVSTVLYRDALTLTCPGSAPVQLDVRGKGNAWTTDPTPTDAVFQYAVYAGQESLTCSGQPCKKQYWNVALGLDLAQANNCTLTSTMTASNGTLSSFTTPSASTYPYISISVPLTTTTSGTTSLACTSNPLNGAGSGVTTSYTSVATPEVFDYEFDGTTFRQRQVAPPVNCLAALNAGSTTSGIYTIDIDGAGPIAPSQVYCDQTTDGGGWTMIAYWVGPVSSTRTFDQLVVAGKPISPLTQDTTNYPALPAGVTNTFTHILAKNANPDWTSLYGTWVKFPVFTTTVSIGSSGFAATKANGQATTFFAPGNGWDPTVGGDGYFGMFTVFGNSGICGGANICGQKVCPAFYTNPYNCHFDQTNAKFLFGR